MNILILTANTGGGHIKATEAIHEHIQSKNLNYNIKILNTLDYINPSFNKLITSLYSEFAKKCPSIIGKMYYYAEFNHVPVRIFSLILKNLSKKLLPIIYKSKIDVIISTHPFSTQMMSYLKEAGKIPNVKLVNLITDYAAHKFWIHDRVDAYITATEQMNEDMIQRGVNKDIIYPIGIPVGIHFSDSYEKQEILNSIGFNEDCFTILLMAGSIGVNCVVKVFELLLKLNKKIQIIAITGNNSWLYQKFNTLISKYKNDLVKVHLLGFTNDVSKYMNASNVIITKPGGLTTTEAISSQLPIIFFDAIPGQEEKNADFILKNKIGMRLSTSKSSMEVFSNLIDDEKILNEMKENISSVRKFNFIDNLIYIMDSLCTVNNQNINYTY